MKKILALLLAIAMVLSLAACGKEASNSGDTTDNQGAVDTSGDTAVTPEPSKGEEGDVVEAITGTYPEEKVLIGVEIYDPTDSEFLELQSYFNYLAETMNVEFKYSEAIQDADGEMKFIEDCAIAGAKGFMAYYNVTGVEQPTAVTDYGMYFWGGAEDPAIYDAFKDNPLYLGSIHQGDGEFLGGQAIGEWVIEQGFDTVIFANGGADFGVPMFVKRQAGFLSALEGSNVKVITVSGFPGDQFFADQAAALGTEGLDAVCASFNGLDFWAQPIASAGLADTVQLGTIGSLNTNFVEAFENGTIDLLASANGQRFGFAVGMICNAVDGNADVLKADGVATNAGVDMWIIKNAEDARKLFEIQNGEKIFSVDEIMSLSKKVNQDASAQTITDLISSATMDNLLK